MFDRRSEPPVRPDQAQASGRGPGLRPPLAMVQRSALGRSALATLQGQAGNTGATLSLQRSPSDTQHPAPSDTQHPAPGSQPGPAARACTAAQRSQLRADLQSLARQLKSGQVSPDDARIGAGDAIDADLLYLPQKVKQLTAALTTQSSCVLDPVMGTYLGQPDGGGTGTVLRVSPKYFQLGADERVSALNVHVSYGEQGVERFPGDTAAMAAQVAAEQHPPVAPAGALASAPFGSAPPATDSAPGGPLAGPAAVHIGAGGTVTGQQDGWTASLYLDKEFTGVFTAVHPVAKLKLTALFRPGDDAALQTPSTDLITGLLGGIRVGLVEGDRTAGFGTPGAYLDLVGGPTITVPGEGGVAGGVAAWSTLGATLSAITVQAGVGVGQPLGGTGPTMAAEVTVGTPLPF